MWSDENILAWSGGGEARHSSTERSPPDSRHPRPTTALLRREDSAESHSSSRQHSGNSGNSGSSSSWMNSTGSRGGADTGRDSRQATEPFPLTNLCYLCFQYNISTRFEFNDQHSLTFNLAPVTVISVKAGVVCSLACGLYIQWDSQLDRSCIQTHM